MIAYHYTNPQNRLLVSWTGSKAGMREGDGLMSCGKSVVWLTRQNSPVITQADRDYWAAKPPICAKGCRTRRDILGVWHEALRRSAKKHPHQKPQLLQQALIEATVPAGGIALDVTAGSFSTMTAAHAVGRRFLGCKILSHQHIEGISK